MARASHLASLAQVFAALSDPTRLSLLNLIDGREVCVCYFVDVLGQSQPKISRHLAYLRRAGLVSARREGKWMHYRLEIPAAPETAALLECTLAALRADRALQADRARLDKACCAPSRLVSLNGAPKPVKAAR
ncbi:MAG TPA: metalloregulator ArsR/SmtB family transcription factor [Terracidiphilus sp.]|nr:metalloregulator ArsR/SmtB family transcription factor [Terracidiphilus sp.]